MTTMALAPRRRVAGDLLPAPKTLRLAETALFADLDGTLAPLEATPGAVKPDDARRRLLDDLSEALGGRLAVVSGRALADLDRVLEGRVAALGAVHGLVRRTADGRVIAAPRGARMGGALEAFQTFAENKPGLLVEDKDAAVALHYRGAPAAADAGHALARRLAAEPGLTVQDGDMVVELRAEGPDKGGAVEAFMAEPPFAGFKPVFVGDDLTDEHGFAAVRAQGGFGVVVGARRPTAALYALPDVGAVQRWLRRALERGA